MPGTVADPVRLDHYQLIREVHWPEPYVAFQVSITRSSNVQDPIPCDPPFEGPVIGPPAIADNFLNTYLLSVDFTYGFAGGHGPVYRRRSGAWEVASGATVSGLPSVPPTQTFSSWQKVASSPGQPWVRWTDAVGDPIGDFTAPSGFVSFKASTSPTYELFGHEFTGGPACYGDFIGAPPVPSGFLFATAEMWFPEEGFTDLYHTFNPPIAYSLADLIVEIDDSRYEPVGIAPVPLSYSGSGSGEPSEPLTTDSASIWILLRHVPPV